MAASSSKSCEGQSSDGRAGEDEPLPASPPGYSRLDRCRRYDRQPPYVRPSAELRWRFPTNRRIALVYCRRTGFGLRIRPSLKRQDLLAAVLSDGCRLKFHNLYPALERRQPSTSALKLGPAALEPTS